MVRQLVLFAVLIAFTLASCIAPLPPDSDPPTAPSGPDEQAFGLLGTYFDSSSGSVIYEQLDERIDRFWSREGSDPLSPPDYFSVVWEGSLVAPESGSYTFSAFGDDGVRVFIDGENVLPSAAWTTWSRGQSRTDRTFSSASIQLSGTHAIRVEFFQYDADAQIQLNWTRPNGVSEVIPSSAFRAAEESSAQLPDGVPSGPSTAPTPQPGPTPPPGGSPGTPDDDPVYVDPNYEPEPQENLPASTGPTQMRSYTIDSTTDFINPERGWLSHSSDRSSFPYLRDQGFTVAWIGFRLDDYRTRPLDSAMITRIESTLQDLRTHGVKGKIRFTYNGNPQPVGEDAPESRIIAHLAQLEPILEEYEDVITMLDAGFVGKWGEWHASDHGLTGSGSESAAARKRISDALLDALPDSRMIGHRYPYLLYELYGAPGYIDRPEYFSGSDQSRIGWLNDCFLMGRENVGTYNTWSTEANFIRDRTIFEQIGRYAVASAETCSSGGGLSEYNTCDAAIEEMEYLSGPDLLNSAYWTPIYDRWRADGCYDEISTRLGYRLSLRGATLPSSVSAGDTVLVEFDMENSGFGKVYNPRPLELVLIGPETRRLRIYDDARWYLPLGGERREITRVLEVPADLQPGAYRMYLALPDASPRLYSDSRYAIRLANAGVWDSARGMNDLGATLTVT